MDLIIRVQLEKIYPKKKEKIDWEKPKLKILINEINRYDLELYQFASENLRK